MIIPDVYRSIWFIVELNKQDEVRSLFQIANYVVWLRLKKKKKAYMWEDKAELSSRLAMEQQEGHLNLRAMNTWEERQGSRETV